MHHPANDNLSKNLFSNAMRIYRSKGIKHLLRSSFWYLMDMHFTSFYYNTFKSSETFLFQGIKYHYIFHSYCTTWKNERCAIIPIALDIVQKYTENGKNILEVGNVISHVRSVVHDVVDKYEIADGVRNEDIAYYDTSKKYDLIISLVTIQHVGYTEFPRDPSKILRAMENLKNLLTPDGTIILLHALGENKEMDELLNTGKLKLNQMFYLKKISKYMWAEAKWQDVKNLSYDYSIPSARGVLIGVFAKNSAKKII